MTVAIMSGSDRRSYAAEILSYSVLSYMIDASGADNVFCTEDIAGIDERTSTFVDLAGLKKALAPNEEVLLFCGPYPCISEKTVKQLREEAKDGPCAIEKGRTAAVFCRAKDLCGDIMTAAPKKMPLPDGEWMPADSAEARYASQEIIRRRINLKMMKNGVFLADPNTTHISPRTEIGEGTEILPNCQIYGATKVGKDCVIGPNSTLSDAVICDGAKINASQINKSTVGKNTSVGPFAYIRPDCTVGENVRIGDFVELKNSVIGNSTKVSHLTYIGDSDLGESINVGCGVVTVNYDGKNKHRTKVGSNSFIGCNVNLVAPVEVGSGAYVAAGSTITEQVPCDSLAIARQRQTVKPEWAVARRKQGKLK